MKDEQLYDRYYVQTTDVNGKTLAYLVWTEHGAGLTELRAAQRGRTIGHDIAHGQSCYISLTKSKDTYSGIAKVNIVKEQKSKRRNRR